MREKSKAEHKEESKDWIKTLSIMPWFFQKNSRVWGINLLSKDGLSMWFHCWECSFNAFKMRFKNIVL